MAENMSGRFPMIYQATPEWADRVGAQVEDIRGLLDLMGTVPPLSETTVGLRYIDPPRTPDTGGFSIPHLLAVSVRQDSDYISLEWHIAGGYPNCSSMFCGAAILGRGNAGLVEVQYLSDVRYANLVEGVVDDTVEALGISAESMDPLKCPESAMVVRGMMRSGHTQSESLQRARGLVLAKAMHYDIANPDAADRYWRLETAA